VRIASHTESKRAGGVPLKAMYDHIKEGIGEKPGRNNGGEEVEKKSTTASEKKNYNGTLVYL